MGRRFELLDLVLPRWLLARTIILELGGSSVLWRRWILILSRCRRIVGLDYWVRIDS